MGTGRSLRRGLRIAIGLSLAAATLVAVPIRAVAQLPDAPSDFNGDGFSDLAAGTQGESIGRLSNVGALNVLYGSATGITADGDQLWHQGKDGLLGGRERIDSFAATLDWGDFNDDGFDDLAVGAPLEAAGTPEVRTAGAVNVIYGSAAGLTSTNNQFWHRGVDGVRGPLKESSFFGDSLATGDIDGDGFTDLIVGVRGRGQIQVLFGSPSGIVADGDEIWSQDSLGILGESGFDLFGYRIAAGDLNGDGFDDVAVSAIFEQVSLARRAGAVSVIYGSPGGLTHDGNQMWSQNSPGILNFAEEGEEWGSSLAIGDLSGDGIGDLAVTSLTQEVSRVREAGAVNVIYGSPAGLSGAGDQFWSQDSPGVDQQAERGDFFGYGLAVGDFDGTNPSDLAVGVPFDGLNPAHFDADDGIVHVLYGETGGLSASGSQLWTQSMLHTIEGSESDQDSFGRALVALDFDGNDIHDLGVGVPLEHLTNAVEYAGAVDVIYGTSTGLSSAGTQFWHQNVPGVLGIAELFDQWASTLTSGP